MTALTIFMWFCLFSDINEHDVINALDVAIEMKYAKICTALLNKAGFYSVTYKIMKRGVEQHFNV
ncbi:hypothetical protein HDU76_002019, partial [Blyttiomyces sp. JEL0837]